MRQIFNLYLQFGCVRLLKLELEARGWKTPERQGARPGGGGLPFTRGHLYRMLSSPIYIGGISHKGVVHPGQHQPIVDKGVWDAVQTQLADNAQGHSNRIAAFEPSLLAGLAQDAQGRPLKTSHAKKGSKRYRYYYSDISPSWALDIIETIARGEQPVGMGVRRLVAMSPLPMEWAKQRQAFGLT